jgi:hypothetical protein
MEAPDLLVRGFSVAQTYYHEPSVHDTGCRETIRNTMLSEHMQIAWQWHFNYIIILFKIAIYLSPIR